MNNLSSNPDENKIKQLVRLLDIGRNLSAMLDLDPLLQMIIEEAANLTDSQEASILLLNEEDRKLQFVAAPSDKRETLQEVRVPLAESIVGEVFTKARPMVVQNVREDARHFKMIDDLTSFETLSLLAVPLMFQGKVTGVLIAVNKLNGKQYTKEDLFVMETLASQASVAINNANLIGQVQSAYENLSELDKMKSDFIAIASHELRTPLGLILGHGTFLQEMVEPDLQEQMSVVVRSAVRLKSIVEDLSKVNNFQSGQARVRWREIDINAMLTELVGAFRVDAENKGLELRLKLPPEKLIMVGDGEKVGIAISHLIRNAIAFTDMGYVEVFAESLKQFIRINVTDSGVGIPETDTEKVFERFYQIEGHMTRRHGGMGLGLSVAKMMVEMHEGRIKVVSKEGQGSTFSVVFPLNLASAATATANIKSP